ncbi:unnamed protein product [Ostreobium quekettii]|uniref:Fe2OG dioxygenase domain-containing protein n=1 Tax=Ostreobium quekettii TaxID=121088 RepID=A0A8S1J286_9CHLO|nr:unnamed protein product [Ostreobium quekettii]
MKRSTVVGKEGHGAVTDAIRTSYGTFLQRMQDPIIEAIENRLASWTQVPAENGEDLQVLRYANNQSYGAHSDVLSEDAPRMATVLLYLSDVEYGGETAFPKNSVWVDPDLEFSYGPWSPCSQGHVAVKPKKRDALLFFSVKPDATVDAASMHTGCPVVTGVKWTATKWIHTKPFRPESFKRPNPENLPHDPGLCGDHHPLCNDWASNGECEKNPEFMISGPTSLGACRASCQACEECTHREDDCYNRNRERGGYLLWDGDPTEWILAP